MTEAAGRTERVHVVVIGAGFGGIRVAMGLGELDKSGIAELTFKGRGLKKKAAGKKKPATKKPAKKKKK